MSRSVRFPSVSICLVVALAVHVTSCSSETAHEDACPTDTGPVDTSPPPVDVPAEDLGAPDTGPDVVLPIGCSEDAECAVPSPCIAGACVSGKCEFTATTSACDDKNACTADDVCRDGACVGGSVVACDDGKGCTLDTCDLVTGCVHTDLTGPCSDGDACTTADLCSAGACVGTAVGCDDNNPCTTDGCDAALGCNHAPADGPCDDGDACTGSDTCVSGLCSGVGIVCDDEDPCTADGCSAATGCFSTPSPDAPACHSLSCDPASIGPFDPKPICPETECTPVCEPIDPATCEVVSGVYRCPPPVCSCGTTKKSVACTLPPITAICDPVCSPPKCMTTCANNTCGNAACPACESTCSEATCSAKCTTLGGFGACGNVFGCAVTPPSCTTTCKPADCRWVNYDDPSAPPACEATDVIGLTEMPAIVGASCGTDGSVTPKAWGVVCKKPECEIKCPDGVDVSCKEKAQCLLDCTSPVCSVTCDPPVCAKTPAGLLTCEPPANCVTTCQCAVGTCTRTL